MTLSKEDRMFKDAIDTAAESKDTEICEDLLRFFVVTVHDKACFSAVLFSCYDYIRPDVVLELSWRYGFSDNAMPYMIQYMRHLHDKIHTLETRTAPPKEAVADSGVADPATLGMGMMGMGMMGNETLMITNGAPGFGAPYGGGYGAPGGMSSIPDPYSQQPAYGAYGGMPAPGGFGAPAPGYGSQW